MSDHPFYLIFFMNSLISDKKALDIGLDIDGKKICVLLDVDDLVSC